MKRIIELEDGWQVQKMPENGRLEPDEARAWCRGSRELWDDPLAASMPAQAHAVLQEHGRIKDPAILGECEKTVWIGETDWAYRTEFDRPEGGGPIYLRFRGIDTYADIYLNGEFLAHHDDCYIPLRLDVSDKLQDRNELFVHFLAPRPHAETLEEFEDFIEDHGAVIRAIRKPAEDFGFFNGAKPSFVSIGLYDAVQLEVVDRAEIAELDLRPQVNEELDTGRVGVRTGIEGEPGTAELACRLLDPDGRVAAEANVVVEISGDGAAAECALTVDEPELWYPLGYGEHPLYDLEVTLRRDGTDCESIKKRIGFRRIDMVGPFDFRVNGLAVKLWGANLTPLPRPGHQWDFHACTRTMMWSENCHMSSIRAWGPGQPWNEQLFDEADERGILIWTEFAHTGGPWPDTEQFRARARREAVHWVKAWKHHPSILLWCGGNETYLGIDVKTDKSVQGAKLFEETYREVCQELDPDRYYHVNSPYGGPYGNIACEGDTHVRNYDWFLPGDDFPLMVTENTRLTIPLRPTLEHHLGEDLQWPEGFTGARTEMNDPCIPPSWIDALSPNTYWVNSRIGHVEEFFDSDGTPDSLLFRIGAGCSRFVRETMERLRRGRPVHEADKPRIPMGHYWWKLNDTWPMIYASLIDDLLQPNMPYYAMRHALEPLLLSIEFTDRAYVWVVNDTGRDVRGTLTVRELDQKGLETFSQVQVQVDVPQGESLLATSCDEFQMFYNKNPVVAELRAPDGELLSWNMEYPSTDRHNWFPEAKLDVRVEDGALVLSTDLLAHWVELAGDGPGWGFEDNYFDLLPGREKRVRLLSDRREGTIRARAIYSPHVTEVEL